MKHRISNKLPPLREIELPESIEVPDGPTISAEVEILAIKENRGLARLVSSNCPFAWLDDYEAFEFSVAGEGKSLEAIKKATEDDFRRYRVPIWIQGEEVPLCCEQEMVFIGQIDDDTICTEPPVGAKLWWHDKASFYVFTCPKCLTTTAVGQQF